jgi:pseudouridine-5'-phosphate glycosidase
MMALLDRLDVAPEVARALAARVPVVALESTLISHGLPYPANLEVAIAAGEAVRNAGAIPATIAIRDGRILVGLSDGSLLALATAPEGTVQKAARPSMAVALQRDGWAATTVSATMIAAHVAGIHTFATGGIGGVHLAGPDGTSWDVSSDLEELARTPVAVVCAGPKAILDVAATLEVLETRGVPVVTIGQPDLPGFFARSAGIRAPISVADEAAAAALVSTHLGLGLGSGILVCVPVPESDALPEAAVRDAVAQAVADAETQGIGGPALTPWLLSRIGELTDGASIRANTALIANNAAVAARLAVALAG